MAISRPQTVTPWADSGSQLAPSGGELASGFASVSRPGFRKLNWLLNYAMNGIRYVAQRGIFDWAADDSYSVGAVTTGPDGITYKATGVPTVGLAPGSDTANWTIFPYLAPFYGDGSSGDRTVTTDTSATPLGAHVNYGNLTIGASGIIKATYDPAIAASVNPIIRVRGTLSIAAGGIIHANGGNASGVTGGAGNASAFANNGAVTQAIFGNFIGGGTGGLNGLNASTLSALRAVVNGTTDGGSPYLSSPDMLIGATASGPNGLSLTGPPTGHSGGASGGQSTGTVTLTASQVLALIGVPGMIPSRQIAPNHTAITWIPLHGGLGGGSGGFLTSDSTGGAGGAGGGVLYIFANNLVLGSATAIQALGGNGGAGTGTAASGGSAGSGGRVIIVCRTFSGVTPTTACVAGGTGGPAVGGIGQIGTAGNTGNLVFVTGV